MKKLGLLGKNIGYSFSRNYFGTKFKDLGLENEFTYENFDVQTIEKFPEIVSNNPALIGLNVTIPYKEAIMPFLDQLSENAKQIGAVNTIKISLQGELIGDNTDYYGSNKCLEPLLKSYHKKALILGTGGAAKAVAFGLQLLHIESTYVSRETKKNSISYQDITLSTFQEYQIIINCTPLGTFPKVALFPDIPYHYFTPQHIAFDLIYNPEETEFLKRAKANGASVKNGKDMLVFQAEKSWEIWNK